jgi:hypothetical protein
MQYRWSHNGKQIQASKSGPEAIICLKSAPVHIQLEQALFGLVVS